MGRWETFVCLFVCFVLDSRWGRTCLATAYCTPKHIFISNKICQEKIYSRPHDDLNSTQIMHAWWTPYECSAFTYKAARCLAITHIAIGVTFLCLGIDIQKHKSALALFVFTSIWVSTVCCKLTEYTYPLQFSYYENDRNLSRTGLITEFWGFVSVGWERFPHSPMYYTGTKAIIDLDLFAFSSTIKLEVCITLIEFDVLKRYKLTNNNNITVLPRSFVLTNSYWKRK